MSREEYLYYRNNNATGEIMYEFYKEGFNAEKHKPFLSKQEFFTFMSMWSEGVIFVPSVHSYYDSKFGVTIIKNKERQIIRFI